MRCVATSDLHGKFPSSKILPDGDVLILAGDILPNLSRQKESDGYLQLNFLKDTLTHNIFNKTTQKYPYVLFVPGNHDICFEEYFADSREEMISMGIKVLVDKEEVIDNVKFYGSPHTPYFFGKRWAFNFPDREKNNTKAELITRATWNFIPDNTDVLITHGPPKGILDNVRGGPALGCSFLLQRTKQIKPLFHIFGHIHDSYGAIKTKSTTFLNVSRCNEKYKPVNDFVVFDI